MTLPNVLIKKYYRLQVKFVLIVLSSELGRSMERSIMNRCVREINIYGPNIFPLSCSSFSQILFCSMYVKSFEFNAHNSITCVQNASTKYLRFTIIILNLTWRTELYFVSLISFAFSNNEESCLISEPLPACYCEISVFCKAQQNIAAISCHFLSFPCIVHAHTHTKTPHSFTRQTL